MTLWCTGADEWRVARCGPFSLQAITMKPSWSTKQLIVNNYVILSLAVVSQTRCMQSSWDVAQKCIFKTLACVWSRFALMEMGKGAWCIWSMTVFCRVRPRSRQMSVVLRRRTSQDKLMSLRERYEGLQYSSRAAQQGCGGWESSQEQIHGKTVDNRQLRFGQRTTWPPNL